MLDLINELKHFLFTAKRSTFAGKGKKHLSALLGGKEYVYQEGDWSYRDFYFGSLKDIGQEIVWHKQSPFWGANYFGGIKLDVLDIEAKEIFEFLKEALLELPIEFPVRGPTIFKSPSLIYINIWNGEIVEFKGREYIFLENKLVYERLYHGGIIHHQQWRKA